MQVIYNDTMKGALLDQLLKEKRGGKKETGEKRKGGGRERKKRGITADCNLFRELIGRIPLEAALEGKGAQESWLLF